MPVEIPRGTNSASPEPAKARGSLDASAGAEPTEPGVHPTGGAGAAMPPMLLSGLEPVTIDDSSLFVNIGERTNVTGSKAFARMILNGEFEQALAVARQQVAPRCSAARPTDRPTGR